MVTKLELGHETAGREIVRSTHFVMISGKNELVMTIRQIDGFIRDIPWDENMIFEPYLIEPTLDQALGSVAEWEQYEEDKQQLAEMKQARIAVKLYVLKYVDGFGEYEHPEPEKISKLTDEHIRPFFKGYLSALTGKIEQ